jgi:hypothetical protein
MILQEIQQYIIDAKRVEEGVLLKHFHLSREGIAPMMTILLQRGKIHKTVSQRGKKLAPLVYYSYHHVASIPMMTVL